MKRFVTLFVLSMLMLGAFCTFGAQADSKVYREEDTGSTIKIAIGELFNVSLFNNLSVDGYDWESPSYDHKVLNLTYTGYWTSEPGVLGNGGRDLWTFQGLQDGETTLTFKKTDTGGDVAETFTLKVVVGKGAEKKDSGYEAGMMLIGCLLILGAVLHLNRRK